MGLARGRMRCVHRFRPPNQSSTNAPCRQTIRSPTTPRFSRPHGCVSENPGCRLPGPLPSHSERQCHPHEPTVRIRLCPRRLHMGYRPRQPCGSIRRSHHSRRSRRHANSRDPSGSPSIREPVHCLARNDARIRLADQRNAIGSVRPVDRCGRLPLSLREACEFRWILRPMSVDLYADLRYREAIRGPRRSRGTSSTRGERTARSVHPRPVTSTLERVRRHCRIQAIQRPSLHPTIRRRQANLQAR